MKNVLFVCRHNENRSPAFQLVASKLLKDKNLQANVLSAGLDVDNNKTHLKHHLNRVLQRRGYGNLSTHPSIPITRELVESSDLVLTMNRDQSADVLKRYSLDKEKLFTVPQYATNRMHNVAGVELPDYFTIDLVHPHRNRQENVNLSENLHMLPRFVARTYLALFEKGLVDSRDKDKLDSIYNSFINDVERYTARTISRMQKEGFFE